MSELKHTPGPWRLDPEEYAQLTDGSYRVIDTGRSYYPNGFRIAEYLTDADARLIASAPDLLVALMTALPCLHQCGANPRAIKRVIEAIDKATGQEAGEQ